MEALILLVFFNFLILVFAIKTKKFLYTRTPEQQWEPIVNEFDRNLKSIKDLDISDYKLGSGHIY